MKTGTELITQERNRQIEQEGWTPEHDDSHTDGELAEAGVCYALDGPRIFSFYYKYGAKTTTRIEREALWPWDDKFWKPSATDVESGVLPQGNNDWIESRIVDLVKSGALIAAEIDRLQRVLKSNNSQECKKADE